jgi:hypothetical protein
MRTALAVALALFAADPVRATTTIFLDRCDGGCTYTPGVDDSRTDHSSLLSGARGIPAFEWGDESWNAVVACVRDAFAPFDAVVTDADPGQATHIEVAVGGVSENLGLPAGILNAAPFTCAVIPNGVAFAFAHQLGDDPPGICWNAAQVAGSMLGLDHELLDGEVMSYGGATFPKTFRDEAASCGEDAPRACVCGGDTQNSYQQLLVTLPEPHALATGGAAALALATARRRRDLHRN